MEKVNIAAKFALIKEPWAPKIVGELNGQVEHRPVAEAEAHVLLFEPDTTRNTGNVQNAMTLTRLDKI